MLGAAEVVPVFEDVRFNGRERAGEKRRAFVCRLTDGRIAVIHEGMPQEADAELHADLAAIKQAYALLVPEIRIPVYQERELKVVQRKLETLSTAATP